MLDIYCASWWFIKNVPRASKLYMIYTNKCEHNKIYKLIFFSFLLPAAYLPRISSILANILPSATSCISFNCFSSVFVPSKSSVSMASLVWTTSSIMESMWVCWAVRLVGEGPGGISRIEARLGRKGVTWPGDRSVGASTYNEMSNRSAS